MANSRSEIITTVLETFDADDIAAMYADEVLKRQRYEAAIAAVAVQAAEWAALAPADNWGNSPHDAVLSDVGRHLQRLLAAPAAAVVPAAEDGKQ